MRFYLPDTAHSSSASFRSVHSFMRVGSNIYSWSFSFSGNPYNSVVIANSSNGHCFNRSRIKNTTQSHWKMK